MRRSERRMRIDAAGGLEIVDPGLEDMPLLRAIDSRHRIRSEPLPGFTVPRLAGPRSWRTNIVPAEADRRSLSELWEAHDVALRGRPVGVSAAGPGLSLLDLKRTIARRLMAACVLCARRCGVNRAAGAIGVCGLGADGYVAEHFVHIAEEAAINPSLVLNLRGCALRCRGCQQHTLLDTRAAPSERLTRDLWRELDFAGARSLSFVGGNPDESIAAALDFLSAAPETFALPVIWNNHAYMSEETVRLLTGVIDCYVPDLKFDREACGRGYTRVPNYAETARASIVRLLRDGMPVIVRVLLLPGHDACCHIPSLEWLAQHNAPNLRVSLRGQYAPDWRITARDGALAERVTAGEISRVTKAARRLGLQLASPGAG